MALRGQHGKERFQFSGKHVAQVPHGTLAPMPTDEEAHPINGKYVQPDLPSAHAFRAVGLGRTPADEKSRSLQAGFFGLEATVHVPNPLAHLVEQAG